MCDQILYLLILIKLSMSTVMDVTTADLIAYYAHKGCHFLATIPTTSTSTVLVRSSNDNKSQL